MKTTAVAKIKYSEQKYVGRHKVATIEKVELLIIKNNTLETKSINVDYVLAQPVESHTLYGRDEGDYGGILYLFKNIEYEIINQKLKNILQNVSAIICQNDMDRAFLKKIVDENDVQLVLL